MIRTFIAIKIPGSVKSDINNWQDKLRGIVSGIKWVKSDNIHITLKFLGNIEEKMVLQLKEAIERSVENVSPFEIEVKGEGCFPNVNRPRVVWVGVDKGKDIISETVLKIENECSKLGFDRENRPYRPHLTVGRVKKIIKSTEDLRRFFYDNPFRSEIFNANEIILMKSDLKPEGPVYTPIE
ncbi:RNA 2',3'-cyclic phosphodiesterase, partial [candidate division KSB1 bacterium]